MVELVRGYGPALLAWGMLLWLRPGPAPGRRLVRLCVLGLAVSQTALLPAAAALTRAAGWPDIELLVGQCAMIVAVWAGVQVLLRLHGYDKGARVHTAWAAFSGAVMCLLFALAPNSEPRSPWVMEFDISYAIALLPEFVVIARLCLRDARKASDWTLRLGLGLVVVGIVAATSYLAAKTAVAISARASFDFSVGQGFLLHRALPTAAHLLVLAGVAVPAIAQGMRRYRRYRQLGPLWFALYQADPAIALEPPGLLRGNMLFPTRLQLYRRVIEIRDGLLAIRPYRPVDEPTIGELGDHQREAAEIVAALHARENGVQLRSPKIAVSGGHDLNSDTEYLCLLADAYRGIAEIGGHRSRLRRISCLVRSYRLVR
jgi:hypothetical protein